MEKDFKPIIIGTGMDRFTLDHVLAAQHLQLHEVIVIDLDKKEDVDRLKELTQGRDISEILNQFSPPPIPITRIQIEDLSDIVKTYDDRSLPDKQQQKYAANKHNFRKRR